MHMQIYLHLAHKTAGVFGSQEAGKNYRKSSKIGCFWLCLLKGCWLNNLAMKNIAPESRGLESEKYTQRCLKH